MKRNLDVNALRTLIAIIETGGFRRASESLNITQPAASQHIRKLESSMQGTVFIDPRKGVDLTSAGRELFYYAKKIISLNDEALTRLAPGYFREKLSVGVAELLAPGLPSLLGCLHGMEQDVQVSVRTALSEPLLERVRSGELDAALLLSPHGDALCRPVGEVGLDWFGCQNDLDGGPVPLVMFIEPCPLRQYMRDLFESAALPYRVAMEGADASSVIGAVNAGIGRTILIANASQWWKVSPQGSESRLPSPPPVAAWLAVSQNCSTRIADLLSKACTEMLSRFRHFPEPVAQSPAQ